MVKFNKVNIEYCENNGRMSCIFKVQFKVSFLNQFNMTAEYYCNGDTKADAMKIFLAYFESLWHDHLWEKFDDRLPMREDFKNLAKWRKVSSEKIEERYCDLHDLG